MAKAPKIRFRFWGKPSRRPKDKAAGNFTTQPYSTCTVRSKIAENEVYRDASAVSNPAIPGFGKAGSRQERVDLYEIALLAFVPALVGLMVLAGGIFAHWEIGSPLIPMGLGLAATLFGGYTRMVSGCKDLLSRKITVNVFVLVALVATLAIGEFLAAAMIVFIMSISGALESYTLDKNRKSIRDLLDFTPPTARLRRGEEEVSIPVKEVQVGDLVIVRPGERVPLDGEVTEGASSVNQMPITGESMPVEKFKGSEVYAGTLNEAGRLVIRVTRIGEETALARIVHLVEEAQSTRAPIQNIADRFTTWFLPTVLFLAVVGYLTSGEITVAVSILLVACPCAFAIATPTAVTAGISNMARRAVLIKGGIFLELGAKIETLLVDKTGTFTLGRPSVEEILPFDGMPPGELLGLAAGAEKYSEHPLARAVRREARGREIVLPDPEEFRIETGRGVTARFNGEEVRVGNREFIRAQGVTLTNEMEEVLSDRVELGKTVMVVARGTSPLGLLSVADEVRPETVHAVTALRSMGVRKITMLTGDNPRVAGAVAGRIGVDDYYAGLLPDEKRNFVMRLQEEGIRVGMIGDGINDAPALAQADVGIAMGSAGTDIAVDTADVTLTNDDLGRVADFLWMSRKVFRRIKLNIFFSIIYNVIGLTLGSLALLTPVMAVLFQEAGCISVVISSTLLLWARPESRGIVGSPVTF